MADKFVIIGNARIRVSNIKNYGLSSELRLYKRKSVWSTSEEEVRGWFNKNPRIEKRLNKQLTDNNHSTIVKLDETIEIWDNIHNENYIYTPAQYMSQYMNDYNNIVDDRKAEAEIICEDEGAKEELNNWDSVVSWVKPSNAPVTWTYRADKIFFVKETKYLYITTYQNDNFKFFEDMIDVNQKLNEIDQLFNS